MRRGIFAKSDLPRLVTRFTPKTQEAFDRSCWSREASKAIQDEINLDERLKAVPVWSEDYWALLRKLDRARTRLIDMGATCYLRGGGIS